jgi:hypothetical protein
MRNQLFLTLASAAMPSMRTVPAISLLPGKPPLWSAVLGSAPSADGPRAAKEGNAAAPGLWPARKRTAPVGAPAYAHVVCAAQHTHQVSGEKYALQAITAGSLGNGSTFGTQVQTQLSVDVTRVDGRAGSPPRGTPV